jgi:hypothetical protein
MRVSAVAFLAFALLPMYAIAGGDEAASSLVRLFSADDHLCQQYQEYVVTGYGTFETDPWTYAEVEVAGHATESLWQETDLDNNGTPDVVQRIFSSLRGEATESLQIFLDLAGNSNMIEELRRTNSPDDELRLSSFPREIDSDRWASKITPESKSRMFWFDSIPFALSGIVGSDVLAIDGRHYLEIYDTSRKRPRNGASVLLSYEPSGELTLHCILQPEE